MKPWLILARATLGRLARSLLGLMRVATPRTEPGWFRRLAHATAETAGRSQAFVVALAVIVVWAVSGPLFRFSDTWQLVINTGTTIVTFLMVFLIQNTQNRDAHAVHLKLDELIRANEHARNNLLGLEDMSDGELEALQREFEGLRARVREARSRTSRPPRPGA